MLLILPAPLISWLVESCLASDGVILLADIAFPDAAAFETGRRRFVDAWDEEEYY
ncbi:MAG: hypothetical protein SVR81_11150 [Chloroflexota bacterium]|nr:hypothetical protein [Chloroflexota bacterium]